MKKTIITLGLLILFYSCYKDKGNYDIKENKNEIVKISGIKKFYEINKSAETFKIKPKINFKNKKQDESVYIYKWVLKWNDKNNDKKHEKVISIKKNLVLKVADKITLPSKATMYFIITDTTTKVSEFFESTLAFTSDLKKGYLILHESEEGQSKLDLSLLKLDDNGKFKNIEKNIYKKVTFQKKLLQEGEDLQASMLQTSNELIIFTSNYSCNYGSILEKKTLYYKKSVKSSFRSNDPPKDLKFSNKGLSTADKNDLLLLISGKPYYHEGSNSLYLNLEYPYFENENKIDYCYSSSAVGEQLDFLFHSFKGQLYLKSESFYPKVRSLRDLIAEVANDNYSQDADQDKEDFLMKGKCFFIFKEYDEYGEESVVYDLLIKDESGDVNFCQLIITDDLVLGSKRYKTEIKPFPAPDYITKKTFFYNHESQRVIFIAHKNIIYKWDYDAFNQAPYVYYTFGVNTEITYLNKAVEDSFIVCTYDQSKQKKGASVYVLDYTEDEGKITDKKENIREKIIDIEDLNL
jgi:hypothetical protein